MLNLITQDRLHDTFLFRWVPPLGYTPFTQDPWQWFLHLIIPWITLSILYIGFYARVLRANMLDIQNEDYVRTARAKGLPPEQRLLRHVLRNSMITFVSSSGSISASWSAAAHYSPRSSSTCPGWAASPTSRSSSSTCR